MTKVTYASQCKGRLWQLKQTFDANLEILSAIDADWVIVDFNSDDGLFDWILSNEKAQPFLKDGKLKLYKLMPEVQYSIPLAKNLAHQLGSGSIVFNLDIDNLIGNSFEKASTLDDLTVMTCESLPRTGRYGRIAMKRSIFMWLGGYDLDLFGAGYHDVNMVERLKSLSFKAISDDNAPLSIPNTPKDTSYYLPNSGKFSEYNTTNMKLGKSKLDSGIYRVNQPHLLTTVDGIDLIDNVERLII